MVRNKCPPALGAKGENGWMNMIRSLKSTKLQCQSIHISVSASIITDLTLQPKGSMNANIHKVGLLHRLYGECQEVEHEDPTNPQVSTVQENLLSRNHQ